MRPLRGAANIFCVIGVLSLASGCGEGGCSRLFKSDSSGVPVVIEKVKVVESSPVTTISGTLIPNDKVDISFPNDAKIQEVYVEVGSTVNKGDPLFRVSEEGVTEDLEISKKRQRELELLLEKNKGLLSNRNQMFEEGKVDQDEITRLEKEIYINEAELERVKAEIKKLTYNIDNVVGTSPIGGVVTKKNISTGSMAKVGETLFTIVDADPIIVSFPLSAQQAEGIATNMPLKVFINELPEKDFTATVTYISPELQREGKTFEVWAAIPNAENVLKIGMGAGTEFVSDRLNYTYVVPESAVLSPASRPFVYKVSKGVAHKAPVTIGQIAGNQAEVIRGLEAGDIVVVKGGEALFDGADVSIWR